MIGLQLYSVRDEMEKDFEGTLRAVKEMGYDGVELCGFYGKTPAEVKKTLDDIGLIPISAHVGLYDLKNDTEGVVNDYKAVGCKNIVIPWIPEDMRPSSGNFETTVRDIANVAEKVNAMSVVMSYHNHDFEFEKIGEMYALDYLFNTVPAEHLKAEIDVCWVSDSGLDAVEYISKYKGRIPLIHIKDFFGKYRTEGFEFRPVGQGALNVSAVCETAVKECGTEWMIVEQDRPTPGKTALECVEQSVRFLRSLGY